MRNTVRPFVPAIFCAALSLITLVANLTTSVMSGTAPPFGSGDLAFYCFLPMCFYFVGTVFSQLQRENRELRARLEELTADRSRGETG